MIGENAVGDYSEPRKTLRKLSVMILIPLLFMGINILVDVIHTTELGEEAVMAIQVSMPVYWIMFACTNVLSSYLTKKVRAALENDDRETAERITSDAMYLGIGVAMIFGLIAYFAFTLILATFFDNEIVDLSSEYLTPYFLLFFVFPSYAIVTGLFSAEGSYRRYTLTILLVVVSNILLDILFVHKLHWGVFGNGLGTVLGVYTGALVGLVMYRRKSGRMMIRLGKFNLPRIIGMGREVAGAVLIPLGEVAVKYAAMVAIIICTSVYATVFYTIPMHIVSVLASAGTAVAMAAGLIAEKMPDNDEKIGFWIHSYVFMFTISVIMAVLSVITMDLAIDHLIHLEDKHEWREYMKLSMMVLSTTIPFMGLRHMNNHIFAKIKKNGMGNKIMLLSIIGRILTYVAAILWIGYPAIYYVIAIDYIAVGAGGTALVWWIQKNRRELIIGDSNRSRTGP